MSRGLSSASFLNSAIASTILPDFTNFSAFCTVFARSRGIGSPAPCARGRELFVCRQDAPEGCAVQGARTEAAQRFEVVARSVPLVEVEVVGGIESVKGSHHLVPIELRHDGGRGDRGRNTITPHDAPLRDRHPR